ncbi:hypothetical protein DNL40_06930 [Xylanimonas oleitrophica]|uniref:Uncharacterized protein n=1 Tax=Xylanimonas oleitrophica TaxID=2607479 RepID=A0A2W5WRV3_9MICO|nr:hypothetical protein [Xylanimonas oleitrophica]PZR53840.1 hypothetical protein DNL40_06930 [Xylanimonas oleitrophica]
MTTESNDPAPAVLAGTTVVVLTEDTLTDADVEHVLALHRDPDGDGVPDPVRFHVLVPADTERNLVTSLVDHLGAGDLRAAWDELLGKEPDAREATATAAEQLAGSVAALRAAGAQADGEVIEDDPLPALRTVVGQGDVREVVVVTYPHAVEDTFHSDWASRARDDLHVPVLHLYAGTSELG